jgi:hypothetical protein
LTVGPWKGFLFQADPDNGYFADFPTLGGGGQQRGLSGGRHVSRKEQFTRNFTDDDYEGGRPMDCSTPFVEDLETFSSLCPLRQ